MFPEVLGIIRKRPTKEEQDQWDQVMVKAAAVVYDQEPLKKDLAVPILRASPRTAAKVPLLTASA